jgi:hypothetical protein
MRNTSVLALKGNKTLVSSGSSTEKIVRWSGWNLDGEALMTMRKNLNVFEKPL